MATPIFAQNINYQTNRNLNEAKFISSKPSSKIIKPSISFISGIKEQYLLILTNNKEISLRNENQENFKNIFCSPKIPKISIQKYLERFKEMTNLTEEEYIFALIYLNRLMDGQKLVVNEYNIHRLILISLCVSQKFLRDYSKKNSFFSKVGGIKAEELFKLEKSFLELIDYNLFIDTNEFEEFRRKL